MGACQSDPRGESIPEQEAPQQVKEIPIVYDAESEKQAIKIQSVARGYKAKQEVEDLKRLVKTHQPPSEIAVSYEGPMESDKIQVQKILEQKFIYPARPEFKDLLRLPPYKFIATNAIYKGQWNQGKRHGRGTQVWPDGSVYQGDWVEDMADGKGRLIHPDGDYYQGDWKKDKAHGNGTFVHVDGNRYDGQWLDDRQHGVGVEQQKDFVYNGHFEFGLKQGKGKITWKTDGTTYEGDFFEGLMQGQGKFQFANGKVYIGQWYQSKMHGTGELHYPDGSKYTGNYENGQKSGHGKMEYPDGKVFEGEWKNGKQNGPGRVITADGRIGEGIWENGKRIKDHIDNDNNHIE